MIRATFVSAIDQALLSLLNFCMAVALLHIAGDNEYGLYCQLIALQALFSPVHAGLFVSAYLALAPRMRGVRLVHYRTSMARAEIVLSLISVALVSLAVFYGAHLFGVSLAWATVLAFGSSLLGLWWREFSRQMCFASLSYAGALRIDVTYVALAAVGIAAAFALGSLGTTMTLLCLGVAGCVASIGPLLLSARAPSPTARGVGRSLALSWRVGLWDTLGSVVTWGYGQSYVYFAALHGGLSAAAEVSAGRLLATPLLLLWTSYANVLRPSAARLMVAGDHVGVSRLARRSVLLVVGVSVVYAATIGATLPIIRDTVFKGSFPDLASVTFAWVAYAMLTGLTTVAASLLRSALKFRQIFTRQVLGCLAAVALLTLSLRFTAVNTQVLALVLVEALTAGALWHRYSINGQSDKSCNSVETPA